MAEVPEKLAKTADLWRRADVRDPTLWTHVLDTAELDDLDRLVRRVRGRTIATLSRDVVVDGPLARAASRWRDSLENGLGFVLVRGVPVDELAPPDLELAYAALGLHLGTSVPQNLSGEHLTHVRDTGADPTQPSTRLYTTRAEQEFHTDGADVIGLLCLRTSRSGGASRIASSSAIVQEIQRSDPELFRVLFDDFPWHYQEPGLAALWFQRPICTVPVTGPEGARLNTFFIPWYIRRSQELDDAPRLTELQVRAISAIETLANQDSFHLDMSFEPGDLQWLKNAAILHKRTAYEDHDAPEQKRHLLRLWLSTPDFADGDSQLRRGVTRENVS
jgi:hypothetical protein